MKRLQRRLLLGPTDFELTDEQWSSVRRRVSELTSRERFATLLRMVPGMLPLLAIPFWLRFRQHFAWWWNALFELAFVIVVVATVFWLLRRLYRRYAFRAIVDLGYFNICRRCGYNLEASPDDASRCPECGDEAPKAESGKPERDRRPQGSGIRH